MNRILKLLAAAFKRNNCFTILLSEAHIILAWLAVDNKSGSESERQQNSLFQQLSNQVNG